MGRRVLYPHRGAPGVRRLRVALLVSVPLAVLGCATGRPPAAATTRASTVSVAHQGPGAPPALVPPNASRVVADVLDSSVWAPGTLPVPPWPSNPDRPVFSLTLSVISSAVPGPEYENLALPGSTVQVFSWTPMPAGRPGVRIEAVLTLAGDARGTRWWVSDIRAIP